MGWQRRRGFGSSGPLISQEVLQPDRDVRSYREKKRQKAIQDNDNNDESANEENTAGETGGSGKENTAGETGGSGTNESNVRADASTASHVSRTTANTTTTSNTDDKK